jgi:hypothetical protein
MTAAENQSSEAAWPKVFREDRLFWRFAAVILGVLSFCKGIRRPSTWAATQSMVNYSHGLVKRGLFGATFGNWFHLEHYTRFSVSAYLVIFIFMALLCLLTVRSRVFSKVGDGEVVAVFFASFTVTFIAHLVGYLDISLGLITVGLLLIKDVRLRLLFAFPLCLAGLLLHESFFLIFFPVVLFSFVVDAMVLNDASKRTWIWALSVLLLLFSVAVTMRLAMAHPMTAETASVLRRELTHRADFTVRYDFFNVIQRSTADNIDMTIAEAREKHSFFAFFVLKLCLFLPTIFLIYSCISRTIRQIEDARARRWLSIAAFLAAISPISMQILGVDTARWDAMIGLDVFLVFLVLCRTLPVTAIPVPQGFRNAAVLAIALSMITGEGLMDKEEINTLPFSRPMRELMKSIKHHGWTAPEAPVMEVNSDE